MRLLPILLSLAAAVPSAAQQPAAGFTRVYELHEVEVLPRPQNAADFTAALRAGYPPHLRDSGVGGTVQVAFVVRPDGQPGDIRVLSTPDSAFEAPTVQAVSLLRFTPAQLGGGAVPVRVEQPITWRAEPAPPAAPPAPRLPDSIHVYDVEEADVRPLPRNYREFEAALEELYPRELREARASAEVLVRFAIDPSGRPQYVHVLQSSDGRFDAISLEAVGRLRFEPAQRGGERVWVWMEVPLEWAAPGSTPAFAASGDSVNGYELSQVDELPRPVNRAAFQRELARTYPAALRAEGVDATVQVRFRVESDGTTSNPTVTRSTNSTFDEPTLRAIQVLRFRPAKVGGRPVRVWVEQPIQWTTGRSRTSPAAGDSVNGYELSAVEVMPRVLNLRAFQQALLREFPVGEVSASATGTVQVRFRVELDGTTSSHQITQSSHRAFNEPTLRAVQVLRFAPARVNGQPVRAWVVQPIQWSIDGRSPAFPELDPRYRRERPSIFSPPADPCRVERC
jgi:TonB family protein